MPTAVQPLAVDPAIIRAKLRHQLRAGRAKLGWTQGQVAKHLGWSTSKIMRIEAGYVGVDKTDLATLARLYEFPEEIDELNQLAKGSRAQTWSAFRDILAASEITFYGFEQSAVHMRTFNSIYVPPLLCAPEVVPLLAEALSPVGSSQEVTARHAEFYVARQRRLAPEPHDKPGPGFNLDSRRRLHCVLAEGALWRAAGGPPDKARAQTQWLIDTAERPNITVQILPFTSGLCVNNTFTLLSSPEAPDHNYIHVENPNLPDVYEDEFDTGLAWFDRVVAASYGPGRSLNMLRHVAAAPWSTFGYYIPPIASAEGAAR